MKFTRLFVLMPILLVALGCDDSISELSPDSDTDTDFGRTATPYDEAIANVSVVWKTCTDPETTGQCALADVPLLWDDVEVDTISIAALRRARQSSGFQAQVWFVDGGPGSPGTTNLGGLLGTVLNHNPALEVFTLDHRGTGSSFHLNCDGYENEHPANRCISVLENKYGEFLKAFSTTNAAIDLAALIEANRREDVPVIVMGISYGTYLAHRFMQIFPDWVDGVILDGIAPPDATFLPQNEYVDVVTRDLFARCGADPFCAAKLGPDPFSRVAATLEMVAEGHCSELGATIDQDFIANLGVDMLYRRPLNELLPGLFYRLERCSAEDVAVWQSVIAGLGYGASLDTPVQAQVNIPGAYSRVLYNNIVLSELWEHPRWSSAEEVESYLIETDKNTVLRFTGYLELFESWLEWPTYLDKDYDDKWAQTNTPMLMLQGELDPATVWPQASRVGEWFDGPHQHFISFPNAAHNTINGTPRFDGSPDCAFKMMLEFIENPLRSPDTTCIDRVYPLDFSGDTFFHSNLTGTDDLWGDREISPTVLRTDASSSKRSPSEIEGAITEVKRHRLFTR